MTKRKRTLDELVAATPPDQFRTPESIAWLATPAVGREWPNPGWDEILAMPSDVDSESQAEQTGQTLIPDKDVAGKKR